MLAATEADAYVDDLDRLHDVDATGQTPSSTDQDSAESKSDTGTVPSGADENKSASEANFSSAVEPGPADVTPSEVAGHVRKLETAGPTSTETPMFEPMTLDGVALDDSGHSSVSGETVVAANDNVNSESVEDVVPTSLSVLNANPMPPQNMLPLLPPEPAPLVSISRMLWQLYPSEDGSALKPEDWYMASAGGVGAHEGNETADEARSEIDFDYQKPVTSIGVDITPRITADDSGDSEDLQPTDAFDRRVLAETTVHHVIGTKRPWGLTAYQWQASLLSYRPLYFEDVEAERYGFHYGKLQPVVSGLRFASTLTSLPYLMAADCPHDKAWSLGHDRPGDRVPYRRQLPPISADGALGAAAAVGVMLAIP